MENTLKIYYFKIQYHSSSLFPMKAYIFMSKGTELHRGGHHTYFLDGGTIGVEKKHILGGGAHSTYFFDGVVTPHNIDIAEVSK